MRQPLECETELGVETLRFHDGSTVCTTTEKRNGDTNEHEHFVHGFSLSAVLVIRRGIGRIIRGVGVRLDGRGVDRIPELRLALPFVDTDAIHNSSTLPFAAFSGFTIRKRPAPCNEVFDALWRDRTIVRDCGYSRAVVPYHLFLRAAEDAGRECQKQ